VTQLADAGVVLPREVCHHERTRLDVGQKCHEGAGRQPMPDPAVHLERHRCRDDQRLGRRLDQGAARRVMALEVHVAISDLAR
jgi:hypothetical protein